MGQPSSKDVGKRAIYNYHVTNFLYSFYVEDIWMKSMRTILIISRETALRLMT